MKSYLPEDIVHIIHLYLPIKSLLRFKGVSKSWYNSITRQQFIKDRIDRIDKSTCRCNIVFTPQGKLVRPFLHSVYSEATDTPMIDINTEIDFEIVASCNDMVLIYIHTKGIKSLISKNFFLYNTSTRKVELSRWYYYNEGTVFGLGYDKFNDAYKIVMIYCGTEIKFTQISYLTNKGLVKRSDKWCICYNLYETLNHAPSVVVNNFPHWLATGPKVTHTMTPFIAYLDATKDSLISLMHFELPGETGYNGDIIDLGVMSGCLCIGCNQRGERGLKIYMMTEYGCSDSWVPLFYVAPCMFQQVKPLGFLKNGRVLLEVEQEKLIVYDLDEKKIEKTCFINQG
ncbi:hypothetical protein LIER_41567 [Lithospermum erythrorhizon]|uniref:F-box domain-containing protein n=1 Tax=Lithospermum erythrorhizon TaxID=34254 RepID=A0AAV3RBK4_LITER